MKRRKPLILLAAAGLVGATLAIAGPAVAAAAVAPAISIDRIDPGLDAVIAPGTKIERVATGFVFTEGPLWARAGRSKSAS